jgi:hypothetical protein
VWCHGTGVVRRARSRPRRAWVGRGSSAGSSRSARPAAAPAAAWGTRRTPQPSQKKSSLPSDAPSLCPKQNAPRNSKSKSTRCQNVNPLESPTFHCSWGQCTHRSRAVRPPEGAATSPRCENALPESPRNVRGVCSPPVAAAAGAAVRSSVDKPVAQGCCAAAAAAAAAAYTPEPHSAHVLQVRRDHTSPPPGGNKLDTTL